MAAIGLVYCESFREYIDPHTMDSIDRRVPNKFRTDNLAEEVGKFHPAEMAELIRMYEPYYTRTDRYSGEKKPILTKRFNELLFGMGSSCRRFLDPLLRFTASSSYFPDDPARHAYLLTVGEENWLQGTACEAVVALEAIWKRPCYDCHARDSMEWCGGGNASFRDLYCRKCGSCYEIKSKKSQAQIDKIFKYGGTLRGGSFKKWCGDTDKNRSGSDYVVIVSRCRSTYQNKSGWTVEIAEIRVVTPKLDASSFEAYLSCRKAARDPDRSPESRKRQMDKPIVFKSTIHTIPSTRRLWFHATAPESGLLDLNKIAEEAFEEVFPGRWYAAKTGITTPLGPTSDIHSVVEALGELALNA